MAKSIEDAAFLDHRLVEFVLSLPSSHKVRRGTQKYLLRHVAKRYLGAKRAAVPKAAFYLPVRKFFSVDFDGFVRDTLSAASVRRDGFFEPAAVNQVVERGLTDSLLDGKRLIAVLTFTLWARAQRRKQNDVVMVVRTDGRQQAIR